MKKIRLRGGEMIVGPGLRVLTKQTSDPSVIMAFWRQWNKPFQVFEDLQPKAIPMAAGMALFLQHRMFGYIGGETGTVEIGGAAVLDPNPNS